MAFFLIEKKRNIFCDSYLLDPAAFGCVLLNYLLGFSRVSEITWITGIWPWRYFWLAHADIWCWRCIRNYLTRKGKQKETWPYDTSLLRCTGVVAGIKELSRKASWKLRLGLSITQEENLSPCPEFLSHFSIFYKKLIG